MSNEFTHYLCLSDPLFGQCEIRVGPGDWVFWLWGKLRKVGKGWDMNRNRKVLEYSPFLFYFLFPVWCGVNCVESRSITRAQAITNAPDFWSWEPKSLHFELWLLGFVVTDTLTTESYLWGRNLQLQVNPGCDVSHLQQCKVKRNSSHCCKASWDSAQAHGPSIGNWTHSSCFMLLKES